MDFCATLRGAGERAMSETRKIAAILVADVVGYSRLTGADEVVELRAAYSWAFLAALSFAWPLGGPLQGERGQLCHCPNVTGAIQLIQTPAATPAY
jgi:hypothetical protein